MIPAVSLIPRLTGAVAVVMALACAGCADLFGPSHTHELIPGSTNTLLYLDVARIHADTEAATAIQFDHVVAALRKIGVEASGLKDLAVAELNRFEVGHGNFLVGEVSDPGAYLHLAGSLQDPPAFSEKGIEFRTALESGWYWTLWKDQWLAACDRVGCSLAAGTLSGREAPLFSNPPEPAMRLVFQQLSGRESFHIVWIPVDSTRDKMEAASVIAGFSVSAYLRSMAPAGLTNRLGFVRGIAAEGHGVGGRVEMMMRVAMSSTEAARMVSGSYGLLQGLGEGLESLAKSLGAKPPPMPAGPEVRMSSQEHVVLIHILTTPRR